MERTCKNVNQNRTANNNIRNNFSRNNVVAPDIHVNQIWMQEADTTGIKIIELNSSTDSSCEEPSVNNFSHCWSYVNNDSVRKVDEDDYRVNQEARRRRRINMDHSENNFATAYANNGYYDRDMQSKSNSFYDTYESEIGSAPIHHQMNCFTIINNQNIYSDSSDDENYEAIEIIELNKSEEKKYWDHVYNEKVATYDTNAPSEKHTIWIYSYKNKTLLSDNDYELVNIPSKEISSTSTSYSISDEEQKSDNSSNSCRAASPIPATYIPRLDLSLVQTLSTVTEVSEINKSHSKDSSHETINLKPRDNWLYDSHEQFKITENSNVVNWMALSPRERRRRSINTNSDNSKEHVLETEVTHAEGIKLSDETSFESTKVNTSTIQVKADIHGEKDTCKNLYNGTSHNQPETKEIKDVTNILPMNISFADVYSDDDKNLEIDNSNKPSIKIYTKLNKTEITDPIEKLDCQNWIAEEKVEKVTSVYDYDLDNAVQLNVEDFGLDSANCDTASRRLWLRNTQLMKPPQWAEYLPITCSPTSLHLSISISSINSKKSWFKRLAKCVKCCK